MSLLQNFPSHGKRRVVAPFASYIFQRVLQSKERKKLDYSTGYRIYLINRPGRLLNSWTLRAGVYVRWALIRGWALIKISASVVCLFCDKTINGNNKMQRCNKARFLSNNQNKTPSLGSLLLVLFQFFGSLRASSPIWATEASFARTRE